MHIFLQDCFWDLQAFFCGTNVVSVKTLLIINLCAVRVWAEGFHDNFELIIARVCLGYITLSTLRPCISDGVTNEETIFDEQTAKALKKWHKAVVKKKPTRSHRMTLPRPKAQTHQQEGWRRACSRYRQCKLHNQTCLWSARTVRRGQGDGDKDYGFLEWTPLRMNPSFWPHRRIASSCPLWVASRTHL